MDSPRLRLGLAIENALTRAALIGHDECGRAPFARRDLERSRKRESIDCILRRARANRGKAAWRSDETTGGGSK